MTLIDEPTTPIPIGLARPRAATGRSDRWQPTRGGLISLWRYWDETFEFHNGRLLLRGPNGSGKSMALELLLPFLLDGDTSPHKLSSAAKGRGTLFDRVMAGTTESTRAGFAWIEFGKGEEVFTVGARIRASRSTGRSDRALFTTTQRIGDELHLLDDERGPISRRALDEAIGTTGTVTDSASRHRDAVRQVLFPTFSADRYESLIGALLSLRREKLSQNLDLPKLSAVLSEALPPLDDHDIAEVAEGFERLDRRRHDLGIMEADLEQIDRLAQRQRRYARSVVAGAAGEVVAAESGRDTIVRTRRVAGEELDHVERELAELKAEDQNLRRRKDQIGETLRGIRESELYQEGSRLAELRSELSSRTRERDDLARTVQKREADLAAAGAEQERADGALSEADGNLAKARRDLGVGADRVGAQSVLPHEEHAAGGRSAEDQHAVITAWVTDRRAAVESVRRLLADHDRAVHERSGAEQRLDAARQAADERHVEHAAASSTLDDRVESYSDAVAGWCSDAVFSDAERGQIDAARRTDTPAEAVDAEVAAIRSDRRERAAVARRDLATQREGVSDERARLVDERKPLEAGQLPTPPSPAWRRRRVDIAGAPLWRLVDIVDGVADNELSAVEAAMAAAGLADAWVTPDGSVSLGPDAADIVLTADRAGTVDGTTLASILDPIGGDGQVVPTSVVSAVLRAIPLTDDAISVDDPVAIGRNGTFRLGSAAGRGTPVPATLFGAAAQERHRRAELDRLDAEIAACDRQLTDIARSDEAIVASLAALEAMLGTCPDRRPADDARISLRDAEVRVADASQRVDDATAEVTEAETAVRAAQRELAIECSRTGLPTDAGDLDAYGAEISHLETQASTWLRRASERETAAEARARAANSARRAADAHTDTEARHRDVEAAMRSLQTRLLAIESSLGSEYEELISQVTSLEDEDASTSSRLEKIRDEQPPLDRRVGTLAEQVNDADDKLRAAERSRVHQALAVLVSGPLLADGGIDDDLTVLDGVTATLAAARTLAAAVANDPADQEARRSRAVEETLHTVRASVAGRIDLYRESMADTDWLGVTGSTGGVRRPISEVRVRLTGELDRAREELAAEEADLFERTLAGSIRNSLADRIRAANKLVNTINSQLDKIRTKAGVGVRLRWDVDEAQPPAVRAARTLLLQDPATLSDEQRTSLQDFVRARVDEARRDVELHSPWEARLRDSLDYRQWHSFGLQISHRDWHGFKTATPSVLQRLSTGERSVSLHLPMLASIAAHYTDGHGAPLPGPRLILLDELFAGVDTANRSQLFGTLREWDLDAVLTSDHEWCQYSSLDGIAIHHLQGGRDDEPATSVRFVWDGTERTLDETRG